MKCVETIPLVVQPQTKKVPANIQKVRWRATSISVRMVVRTAVAALPSVLCSSTGGLFGSAP